MTETLLDAGDVVTVGVEHQYGAAVRSLHDILKCIQFEVVNVMHIVCSLSYIAPLQYCNNLLLQAAADVAGIVVSPPICSMSSNTDSLSKSLVLSFSSSSMKNPCPDIAHPATPDSLRSSSDADVADSVADDALELLIYSVVPS